VAAELREQDKRARCVTLKVRYSDFATITRRQTLWQSTASDQIIFDAGAKLLDRVFLLEKRSIRLIGIGVANLVESGRQLDMLDTSAQRLEQLDCVVDHIRKKYGFTAIQTGHTLSLKDLFPGSEDGYTVQTSNLPR
jgi:DNA polymerase-4